MRPVSTQERVGEHSAVVWKLVYRRPSGGQAVERRRGDVRAEAAQLGEPDVVEHDDHDVGRPVAALAPASGHHGLDSSW